MKPKPSKTKPKKCKHWISPTKDTDGICTEILYAYEYCKGYDVKCSDYKAREGK